jgi:O-methyltransferase
MLHLKTRVKSVLARLGHKHGALNEPGVGDVDFLAAATVKDSQYYAQWSPPYPLFSPWLGHPAFQSLYDGIEPYTLVSRDRCYFLASLADYASHLSGEFAECGVYKGGTALLLARILRNKNKDLYLFDSFKGLPKEDETKDKWYHEGDFAIDSLEDVKLLLQEFSSFIYIRQGWIPETFTGLESNRYAFVHVDVDLYRSTLDCCQYFYSRLAAGGVLLFDEYGFAATRGEKDAVDEFFSDKAENPISLPTGQAMVLKLPAA